MVRAHATVQLPPKAGVHRQVRTQLEVVLDEHRHNGPAIALVVRTLLASARIHVAEPRSVLRCALAQKKILEGLEGHASPLIVRIIEVELVLLPKEAGTDTLLAVRPTDLVADLKRIHRRERNVVVDPT